MIINNEYKQQLQEMHKNPNIFNNGKNQYKCVRDFLETHTLNSVIDFGCGKGGLISVIKELHPTISVVDGYDPGYKEFETIPSEPHDCLISTDALEHIEPEHLDSTLELINRLFTRYCFLRIACYPAKKSLPDRRNAHLIVQEPQWWVEKLKSKIDGEFVEVRDIPFHGKPKKGPEIFGKELFVLIKKN
jgi:cyclopropane fatty-acyl-phospholipid synthase-like methyltransferase